VISIFVAASEEEIKKMDRLLGSTERVCYPSFWFLLLLLRLQIRRLLLSSLCALCVFVV